MKDFSETWRGKGILLLVCLVLTANCAKRAPVVVSAPAAVSPISSLRSELDALFNSPVMRRASWAAVIESLDRGDTLFSLNAGRLMMPASNMKIVTLAVTAEQLGWNYRFTTKIQSTASIDEGILRGDLVILGTGDPTLKPATFDRWAQQLWDSGIRKIDGRIIGNDNSFDDEGLGAGWAWDYLAQGYAAPTGALQFNDNIITLSIQPGATAGDAVTVSASPLGHGLLIANRLTTGAADSPTNIEVRRLPGQKTLEVAGSVRAGEMPLSRTASIDNPTEFFVGALKEALHQRGIIVTGISTDIDEMDGDAPANPGIDLIVHQSATLHEIATTMMKVSQNGYADTFLKLAGTLSGVGSATNGRAIARQVRLVSDLSDILSQVVLLETWEIPPDQYVMYDGSGLSRYNYVTAEMLARILRRMAEDPKHSSFISTLPIAGRDGTLSRRMRGTPAEGNAHAKTGSISNVRALSGYVTTADGERLIFSILANHFTAPQRQVDDITDQIVNRLAAFRRAASSRP